MLYVISLDCVILTYARSRNSVTCCVNLPFRCGNNRTSMPYTNIPFSKFLSAFDLDINIESSLFRKINNQSNRIGMEIKYFFLFLIRIIKNKRKRILLLLLLIIFVWSVWNEIDNEYLVGIANMQIIKLLRWNTIEERVRTCKTFLNVNHFDVSCILRYCVASKQPRKEFSAFSSKKAFVIKKILLSVIYVHS